jgi:uncharacterized protein YqeY
MVEDEGVRGRLRRGLTVAMKGRDRLAVAAIRATLGAIDDAEAVDNSHVEAPMTGPIAKAVTGLGAGEAPRRELSEDEVRGVVRGEIEERRAAAATYREAGEQERADRLDAEAEVVDRLCGGLGP